MELAARAGDRVLTPVVSAGHRWVLLGTLAPPVVWGTALTVGSMTDGLGWNVHTTSGLLVLTAATGAATALVTRHVRAPAGA